MSSSATIQYYYLTILQRPADAGGLAGFSALVDSGTLTLAAVRGAMINSTEAANGVMPVIRLYQGALGRVPDAAGLQNWVAAMSAGTPLLSIAQGFVGSAEFQATYGSGSLADLAFITGLYQRVLLRQPDASGLQNWLNAGVAGMSRAQMLIDFTESTESVARWTPPATAFLDTVAQNLPYAYASLAETLPPQGTPYALVGGENTITGTTGSDVFTAPVVIGADSRAHATLTSLDVLDGGTGQDTLVATLGDDPALANVTAVPVLRNLEALQLRAVYLARTLDLSHSSGVTSILDSSGTANLSVTGTGSAGAGTSGIGLVAVASEGSDTSTTVTGLQTGSLAVHGLLAGNATLGQYHDITLGFTRADGTSVVPVAVAVAATLETAAIGLAANAAAISALSINAAGISGLRTNTAAGGSLVFASGAGVVLTGGGSFVFAGALDGVNRLDTSGYSGTVSASFADAALATLLTGSGGDTITLGAMAPTGLRATLGTGANTLNLTGTLSANSTLDGGAGSNVLALQAPPPLSAVVRNFGSLVLTGTAGGMYDLAGFAGVQAVSLTGGAQTLVLRHVLAGAGVSVQSAGYAGSVLPIDLTLGLAGGASGAVGVSLVAVDGNNDSFAGASVSTMLRADTMGGALSGLAVHSTAIADTGLAVAAYQNTLDIGNAVALQTLTLQADAGLHIAGMAGPAGLTSVSVAGAGAVDLGIAGAGLTRVDAGRAQGQVQLNATGGVAGLTYAGSAGMDIVSFSAAHANAIQGNGGNDIFILGAGSTDRLVYAAAADAQFVNTSGLAGITQAHDGAGFERVLNFGTGDHVDLTAFHFTGGLANVLDVSARVGAATDLTSLANLFTPGAATYGVAIAQLPPSGGVSDVLVFVNTARTAGFSAASELALDLRGPAGSVSAASFLF